MSGKVVTTISMIQPAKRWWSVALVLLGALLVLIFIAAARRNQPMEETVTLARSVPPPATTGLPVGNANPLPAVDRDLELLGDWIAEATVHARDRQRGPALRAITAAENLVRQIRETRPDLNRPFLSSTAAELIAIERDLQRGELESTLARLVQLSRTLDTVVSSQS